MQHIINRLADSNKRRQPGTWSADSGLKHTRLNLLSDIIEK